MIAKLDRPRMISERTKAALAAARARGTRLGCEGRNLPHEARVRGRARGSAAGREKKIAAYAILLPTLRALAAEGLSLRAIAGRLNADGQTTRNGKPWNAMQVS